MRDGRQHSVLPTATIGLYLQSGTEAIRGFAHFPAGIPWLSLVLTRRPLSNDRDSACRIVYERGFHFPRILLSMKRPQAGKTMKDRDRRRKPSK